jgi:hypothetical protein
MIRSLFCALVLAACSPAPMPVSTAANDPSNPAAPEGSPRSIASAPAHEHADTTFVCPMHPDVTSTEPGRCGKCGMNLVPKK